jgi:hypothetical protein
MVTYRLFIGGEDRSCDTLRDVSIDMGRTSADGQPDPGTFTAGEVADWTLAGTVGDTLLFLADEWPLFRGYVTDLDTQVEYPAGRWPTRVIAAGPLTQLGHAVIGDEPWPQESDSARIQRILDLVGAHHEVLDTTVGPDILPRDVDRRTAADLVARTADSARGVLWEDPHNYGGELRYLPRRLRAWTVAPVAWLEVNPPTLEWDQVDPTETWAEFGHSPPGTPLDLHLDCSEVLADVTWSQRVADTAQSVRVAYGVEHGQSGDRPEVHVGSGLPEVRLDTDLADEADALEIATELLSSRRGHAWRLQSVIIPMHLLTDKFARHDLLGHLGVGTRLTLDTPAPSPTGTRWQGYLEGWSHHIDMTGGWWLTLHGTDRSLTEPAARWDDTDAALTWATVPADLTWDTALTLGGP